MPATWSHACDSEIKVMANWHKYSTETVARVAMVNILLRDMSIVEALLLCYVEKAIGNKAGK